MHSGRCQRDGLFRMRTIDNTVCASATDLRARSALLCVTGCDQPCLCLCLGFSQMMRMLPFLLMTLHFSQIGFTDDLTFIVGPPFLYNLFSSYIAPSMPRFVRSSGTDGSFCILRRRHKYPLPAQDANCIILHLHWTCKRFFYLSRQMIRPLVRS